MPKNRTSKKYVQPPLVLHSTEEYRSSKDPRKYEWLVEQVKKKYPISRAETQSGAKVTLGGWFSCEVYAARDIFQDGYITDE